MIELNESQLDELEAMAKLMLSKKEIAVILEIDEHEFLEIMDQPFSAALKRFYSGRMKTIAEVRKSVFELAANGSSPAQTEAMKIIRDSVINDL